MANNIPKDNSGMMDAVKSASAQTERQDTTVVKRGNIFY